MFGNSQADVILAAQAVEDIDYDRGGMIYRYFNAVPTQLQLRWDISHTTELLWCDNFTESCWYISLVEFNNLGICRQKVRNIHICKKFIHTNQSNIAA